MSYISCIKYILMSFLLVPAVSVMAQAIPVDSAAIKWNGSDSLTVSFPLTSEGVEIRRNTRLIVTPRLSDGEGNEIMLPQVEFATRRNRKYNDRISSLYGMERNMVYGVGDTVYYTETVGTEKWMLESPVTLTVMREKEGCCNIETISENNIATASYLPPFVPVAAPLEIRQSEAAGLAVMNPILRPSKEYKPFDRSVPLSKRKGALYIHFPVNKYVIDPDFRDNRVTLDRIIELVKQVENNRTFAVTKIVVVGLASPEGPVAFNEKIALKRAEALKKYVSEKTSLPDSIYDVIGAGEAWADLEYVIENSNIPEKQDVLQMLDSTDDPNEKERLLRKFNGGSVFRYLKQDVFADQRNSGYIEVYYEDYSDEDGIIINNAVQLVREEKYEEAVELLKNLDDSRKYNTLGVAYYMSGLHTEAGECFRKAAECGNGDAVRNLEELRKRGKLE